MTDDKIEELGLNLENLMQKVSELSEETLGKISSGGLGDGKGSSALTPLMILAINDATSTPNYKFLCESGEFVQNKDNLAIPELGGKEWNNTFGEYKNGLSKNKTIGIERQRVQQL